MILCNDNESTEVFINRLASFQDEMLNYNTYLASCSNVSFHSAGVISEEVLDILRLERYQILNIDISSVFYRHVLANPHVASSRTCSISAQETDPSCSQSITSSDDDHTNDPEQHEGNVEHLRSNIFDLLHNFSGVSYDSVSIVCQLVISHEGIIEEQCETQDDESTNILTMNHNISRTNSEDIKQLIELYDVLRPQELHFLIELSQRWSPYDPNKMQNMTVIIRETCGSEHTQADIERVVKYLNSPDSIQLFSACHICLSILDAAMADVLSVRVYTLKGTITSQSLQHNDTVYLGDQCAFERSLIENYTCQLIIKASSWQKFVDGLNLGAFNSNLTDINAEWRKRLAMAFIKYKVVEFDLFIGSSSVSIPKSAREFDKWIWTEYPRLLSSFIYLWRNHKILIKSCGSDCTQSIIIDGHQKCHRRVCRAKHVQVSTEEFDSLTAGCCRTPCLGSCFCKLHQHLDEDNTLPASLNREAINNKRRTMNKTFMGRYRQRGFGATNCRTIKERSATYIERCNRSFGILAGVTNCKILNTFSEIFRSETLREIISLLCSTIRGEYTIRFGSGYV
ncbi:unnamed protein product [Rotaria socialis]|uniref:Uncharacterized protein n=1 Tax=Rotaria socialis TaxID=392032 RepID=A0A817V3G6_9BILA|nr:unnamed protein product [Rotaria socialis]CAF4530900.1 unnamed protein product [Rotaria socialis]